MDGKTLLMPLPLNLHHLIFGHRLLTRLQPLLQTGLRIFQLGHRRQCIDAGLHQLLQPLLTHLKAAIQIDRTNHRLYGIGQNGVAAVAATLHLSSPQQQCIAKLQLTGNLGQALTTYQTSTQTAQITLGDIGIVAIEQITDHKTEN